MKTKFTAQDIIDMGAELYDNKGFSRIQIKQWLTILIDNGYVDLTDADAERLFDLIVG